MNWWRQTSNDHHCLMMASNWIRMALGRLEENRRNELIILSFLQLSLFLPAWGVAMDVKMKTPQRQLGGTRDSWINHIEKKKEADH
ncbi:hypothetical protein H5410_028123 [Solanum commersonii]|uniref:Uncharacterized protein n=1 Tax=Solanum commersonii TaxID=4109 RepID=A0A9J5Z423_SOLCO|nr:hypothetical protein H5410_028123 [Solanum commersonii]